MQKNDFSKSIISINIDKDEYRKDGLPAPLVDWLASRRTDATVRAYGAAIMSRVPEIIEIIGRGQAELIDAKVAWATVEWLSRRYKPATVAATISALSSLWRHLQAHGIVRDNPWPAQAPRVRETVVERILTEEQLDRLLAAAAPGLERRLIRLLYATGARVSELCVPTPRARERERERHGLYWRDVRFHVDGSAVVSLYGKRGKTRTVQLPPEAAADLGRPGPADQPVLLDERGRPLTRFDAYHLVKRVAYRAGMPGVSPHWLRHAHGAHALLHGAPPNVVQATLGHADLRTTSIYTRIVAGEGSARYLDLRRLMVEEPDQLRQQHNPSEWGEQQPDQPPKSRKERHHSP